MNIHRSITIQIAAVLMFEKEQLFALLSQVFFYEYFDLLEV
jgi:hypothetical protein